MPEANKLNAFLKGRDDVWEHSQERNYVTYVCANRASSKAVHDAYELHLLENIEREAEAKAAKSAPESPKDTPSDDPEEETSEKEDKTSQDDDSSFTKQEQKKSGCKGCGKKKEEK